MLLYLFLMKKDVRDRKLLVVGTSVRGVRLENTDWGNLELLASAKERNLNNLISVVLKKVLRENEGLILSERAKLKK